VRYAAVDFFRNSYAVEVLCEALSVSKSGYNQWKARSVSKRQQADAKLLEQIRHIHANSRGAYGSPRIHQALKSHGICVGKERIRKLMQAHHIIGLHRKRCCRTTDSNHNRPTVPNVLRQNFTCEKPNTVWLADITYVATGEGFLFVAAMKDLCTRKIVGWSMSNSMQTQLVIDALTMAVDRQAPASGLIVHSDRGAQYASSEFQGKLIEHHMQQSMSARGNCYDNAPMESFFASLKTERLEQERFGTQNHARAAVFEYIEAFYNPVRLHSGIGYRSPNQYEALLKKDSLMIAHAKGTKYRGKPIAQPTPEDIRSELNAHCPDSVPRLRAGPVHPSAPAAEHLSESSQQQTTLPLARQRQPIPNRYQAQINALIFVQLRIESTQRQCVFFLIAVIRHATRPQRVICQYQAARTQQDQ
jgi:putative transposase